MHFADIQLIRGRFWLQLWTLKKFSKPRVSLNDGAKEVGKNGESWTCCADTIVSRVSQHQLSFLYIMLYVYLILFVFFQSAQCKLAIR